MIAGFLHCRILAHLLLLPLRLKAKILHYPMQLIVKDLKTAQRVTDYRVPKILTTLDAEVIKVDWQPVLVATQKHTAYFRCVFRVRQVQV